MPGAGPVQLAYDQWAALYPELRAWVQPAMFDGLLSLATSNYIDNTACNPCDDPKELTGLIGLVVAHLAALRAPMDGVSPSKLVGRITNASQGSVSVATEYAASPEAAFWLQTPYGSMYWQATRKFSGWRYDPGFDPYAEWPGFGFLGV